MSLATLIKKKTRKYYVPSSSCTSLKIECQLTSLCIHSWRDLPYHQSPRNNSPSYGHNHEMPVMGMSTCSPIGPVRHLWSDERDCRPPGNNNIPGFGNNNRNFGAASRTPMAACCRCPMSLAAALDDETPYHFRHSRCSAGTWGVGFPFGSWPMPPGTATTMVRGCSTRQDDTWLRSRRLCHSAWPEGIPMSFPRRRRDFALESWDWDLCLGWLFFYSLHIWENLITEPLSFLSGSLLLDAIEVTFESPKNLGS